MDQYSLLLIKSLIEATQQDHPFKDFIFPVVSSLFSAIMGGLIAIYINNQQEISKAEKDKFKCSMHLMFTIIESLNNLITVKENYRNIDTKNPYLRLWIFPETLLKADRISIDLPDFSFIKELKTCNFSRKERMKRFISHSIFRKAVEKPSNLELGKSWRNLSRLSALISNYNTAIYQIEKRNVLDDDARKKVHDYIKDKSIKDDASFQMALHACLSDKEIHNLIDLTELTISLIDHVIKEMDSFVREFPDIAESNINLSKLKTGKRLIRYNNDRQAYAYCLKKNIEPDFHLLASLFRVDIESIKKRYTLTDWY
ncbi:hypothetical protein F3J37_21710 [Pantoea sp. Al-1710]|uniref:Uncharacterized protein n=1 Tax=Candidatus Pantoea communis TaxID=2608354 RepID=A0ABX0RUL7_9GAMM|nr:hypothetical protein [Pantoea communis]NIG21293.1 hypothetical protein [Pantoea communis]